jgi:hypothetical protein
MRKKGEIINLTIGFLITGTLIFILTKLLYPIKNFSDFTFGLLFAGVAFLIAEELERRKKK